MKTRKEYLTRLHKFGIYWQTLLFAEHFGNNSILWRVIRTLRSIKISAVFCVTYCKCMCTVESLAVMYHVECVSGAELKLTCDMQLSNIQSAPKISPLQSVADNLSTF